MGDAASRLMVRAATPTTALAACVYVADEIGILPDERQYLGNTFKSPCAACDGVSASGSVAGPEYLMPP